jgi:hypothetical protein
VPDTPVVALPSTTPRGLHPTALHSAVWVDDAVYATKTAPHPPCLGLAGGRAARSARFLAAKPDALSTTGTAWRLSLALASDDKRQLPSQRVTYTGMVVDTFHHTLSITPEKGTKLAAFLEDVFARREETISDRNHVG